MLKNQKRKKIIKNQRGIVMIAALLIMVLLASMSAFFIGSMISEFRIATSNKNGTIGFYVAESGVEEAIFKVKNESSFTTGFLNGTLNASNGTFTRNPYLTTGSSYTVVLESIAPGEVQITSTGRVQSGIISSQKIVKTKLVRGVNPRPPWQSALYGSGDIDIFGSAPDIIGDLYAVNDVDVWGFSHVDVTGNVFAGHNINTWLFSRLDVSGEKRAENFPPEPDPIEMPIIDFDSENPNSLLSQANQIYTQQEFKNLLDNNPVLTLNGITYVRGNIDLKQTNLTINGLLVSDGNIDVGMTNPSGGRSDPTLTVTYTEGQLSGVLAKSKIKLGVHARNLSVDGLIYCLDEFTTFNFANNLNINGGIIAGVINLRNLFTTLNINYDASRINPILQLENSDSPVVQTEHWEESY